MTTPATAIDYAALALADLAARAQTGDRSAFGHIMQRCNQRLFRVARAVLNDDDEAEDALQDAYINAWRHLGDFRGDAELTTWLTRIVLNACHARRRKQRPSVELDALDTPAGAAHVITFPARYGMEDPIQTASNSQLRGMIEQAMADLPEPFRVVFVLRDVEGLDTEETAVALGIRAETVKTRLFRARRHLRDALHARLAVSLSEAFPFLGTRCAAFTDRAMQRLADLPPPGPQRP